jgi:hypothetical protein
MRLLIRASAPEHVGLFSRHGHTCFQIDPKRFWRRACRSSDLRKRTSGPPPRGRWRSVTWPITRSISAVGGSGHRHGRPMDVITGSDRHSGWLRYPIVALEGPYSVVREQATAPLRPAGRGWWWLIEILSCESTLVVGALSRAAVLWATGVVHASFLVAR